MGAGCVTYGKINLNLISTQSYRREVVKTGPDYLYTKLTLHVRAVFNPKTQNDAYIGDTVPRYLPIVGAGGFVQPVTTQAAGYRPNMLLGPLTPSPQALPIGGVAITAGAYTAESVKHMLMQPRQQLIYEVGDVNVVYSPLPGYRADANNGPFPLSCDVVQTTEKTFLVDFVVETYVRECVRFTNVPGALISHLWEMHLDLDHDFYTTRRIRGRAIFDAQLVANGVAPDSLRRVLIHPVPQNFKRESIQVYLEQDGVTLNYEVVDRELALNIGHPDVTRVEAIHHIENGLPNPTLHGVSVGGLAGSFTSKMQDIIDGTFDFMKWGKPALGNSLYDWARFGLGATATSTHMIKVKVWGTRAAPRNTLEEYARQLITTRIRPIRIGGILPAIKSSITHDVAGSAIEAQEIYIAGPLRPLGSVLPNQLYGVLVFGNSNNTGSLLTTNSATVTKQPPNDSATRGTYLGQLVGQVLSTPCLNRDSQILS